MPETAAHLTDHVFLRLPVRQWVRSVPKRRRNFVQRDRAVLNMVGRFFCALLHFAFPMIASTPDALKSLGFVKPQ